MSEKKTLKFVFTFAIIIVFCLYLW